jgi:hypothetical protein
MHVIRPFWGGEPGETVVFDTVIVAEYTELNMSNLQMLAGSSSCKTAQYSPINSVQQDYPVGGAFRGGYLLILLCLTLRLLRKLTKLIMENLRMLAA